MISPADILWAISSVFSISVLIALSLFLVLANRKDGLRSLALPTRPALPSVRKTVLFALSAFGLYASFYAGTFTLLFWVPAEWRFANDVEFGNARHSLAFTIALVLGTLSVARIAASLTESHANQLLRLFLNSAWSVEHVTTLEQLSKLEDECERAYRHLGSQDVANSRGALNYAYMHFQSQSALRRLALKDEPTRREPAQVERAF